MGSLLLLYCKDSIGTSFKALKKLSALLILCSGGMSTGSSENGMAVTNARRGSYGGMWKVFAQKNMLSTDRQVLSIVSGER